MVSGRKVLVPVAERFTGPHADMVSVVGKQRAFPGAYNFRTDTVCHRLMDLLSGADEASLRDFLAIVFEEERWKVTTAGSLAEENSA